MQFTIPNSFTGTGDKVIKIDREPTLNSSIRTHNFTAQDFPLEQSRPDGINVTSSQSSFQIVNLAIEDLILIDSYFTSLTSYIDVTYPDSLTPKQVYIVAWSIVRTHQPYGNISITGRIVP